MLWRLRGLWGRRLGFVLRLGRRECGWCIVRWRCGKTGRGTSTNCLIFALAAKSTPLAVGSEAAEIVPELDAQPSDIVAARSHGMTPFTSTSLDQILRNMGITTVVACGQSLNIGIPGMVMSAVDLGYHVVVPADAVVGVPQEYGDEVLRHTLPYLASVTTTDEIIGMWQT